MNSKCVEKVYVPGMNITKQSEVRQTKKALSLWMFQLTFVSVMKNFSEMFKFLEHTLNLCFA